MGHQNGEDYHLVSSLDDIAWILNLRGQDIEDTPVFLAHLLIGPEDVKLFTPASRFVDVKPDCYSVLPYDSVADELSKLVGELKGRPNKELIDLTRKIRELTEKYR